MDQLPRLGKRELICLLLFTCNYVASAWRGFLFLWVPGMGYVILLWHSLSLPYNYFVLCILVPPIQPYCLHGVLNVHVFWTLFLWFLTTVYVPNCAMPRLQHAGPETSLESRISFNYSGQLIGPDLAPIELVWDIL